MNDTQQKQLGTTLWATADKLRGAMNADDFRDYMLSFLFLRYLLFPCFPKVKPLYSRPALPHRLCRSDCISCCHKARS